MDNAELLLTHKPKDLEWDMSSWEYLVSLLCQALCLNKVLPILGRLKTSPLSTSTDFPIGMASMQINLARAAALLCDTKSSKKAVAAAIQLLDQDASIQTNGHDDGDDDEDHEADHHKHATGGKRSWKSGGALKVGGGGKDESRERSLQLFREHRRAELRAEAQQIDSFLVTLMQAAAQQSSSGISSSSASASNRVLPYLLRILSFPPTKKGSSSSDEKNLDESTALAVGTETADQGKAKKKGKLSLKKKKKSSSSAPSSCEWIVNEDNAANNADTSAIVRTTIQRFGLARFLQRSQATTVEEANTQASSLLRKIFAEESGLLQMTVAQKSGIDEVDVKSVPPLKMEICSGAGEWVVAQVRATLFFTTYIIICNTYLFFPPSPVSVGRCRPFQRVAGARAAT